MLKIIKRAGGRGMLIIAGLFWSCSQQPTQPLEKVISFKCICTFGEIPRPSLHGDPKENKVDKESHSTHQTSIASDFDLSRVMVVDFSAYGSWDEATNTEDWEHYVIDRNSWTGDLKFWGEWEKLIGNHFNIVANQTLTIGEDHATGTVTGVIGLNRIVVTLINQNPDGEYIIEYWGEASALGIEGGAQEIRIPVDKHSYQ